MHQARYRGMSVIADRVFELSVRCFQFRCVRHELPCNGIFRIIRSISAASPDGIAMLYRSPMRSAVWPASPSIRPASTRCRPVRRTTGEESVSGKVTVSVRLGIIAAMPQNETPQNSNAAWWHPERFEDRADFLVRRADMVKSVREFFDRNGYVEVETPSLQISPGMEPHLSPFRISSHDPQGGRRQMYLHASPEFAMKKLLAAGMQRIFQLARVFRDGERSAKHHPEFTMLEWYHVGADWRALADETAELVRAVCGPVARFGEHVCKSAHPGSFCPLQRRWSAAPVSICWRPHPIR